MVQHFFLPTVVLSIALSAGIFVGGVPASARSMPASSAETTTESGAQAKQSESPDASGEIDVENVEPVSDTELSQFATVLLTLQGLQNDYRQQAISIIEAEGLSTERFDQLLALVRSPQAPESTEIPEATTEETGQFERALTQIGEVQGQVQEQMRQAILDEGLALDRFQEIAAVVNTDQNLESRVRQIMEEVAPSNPG